ncbi:hypothetical protein EDB81DRAFT_753675 [Dactylonectria macrodidyma]|uniref:Amino acid transporter transmembrane domain-containing protein n=1 Tax=Dactylonectria macrodidyma TaxID=307937 RepID=A0A9P9FPV6_9HYPO|nr:hypothetical protein EDB81DRAFT_753675 [Dactylonectria macrodidyma]
MPAADNEKKIDPEGLSTMPSGVGEVHDSNALAYDEVFGDITVGWIGPSVLMMKIRIGLGILAIPASFDELGLIPGIILLCFVGAMTTWTGWVIGVFKLRHREVYGIDDAIQLMFGRIARETFGVIFCVSSAPSVASPGLHGSG